MLLTQTKLDLNLSFQLLAGKNMDPSMAIALHEGYVYCFQAKRTTKKPNNNLKKIYTIVQVFLNEDHVTHGIP